MWIETIVVIILITGGIYFGFFKTGEYVIKNPINAVGTVIGVEKTPITQGMGSSAERVCKITLQIEEESGSRNIVIKQPFKQYARPEPGDIVNIIFDADNKDYATIVVD